MIQGIDVIYLHAKVAGKTRKWYEEVLGLKVKFRTPDNSWLEFDFDKSPPTRFAVEASPVPSGFPVEQQGVMISFRVDDLTRTVKDLEEKGIEFFGTPRIKEEGVSRFATLQDPEGNWLQLSERIK
ncbi:MAG: VOC family protein [Candidatus Thorarchaeota archaeon]